jgi:HAD superfamily hydrolase (TIGR01509 family)
MPQQPIVYRLLPAVSIIPLARQMSIHSILGVIFDLDGTLVDSRLDFDAMRHEIGLPRGTPVIEGVLALPRGHSARAWEIVKRHERIGAEIATVIPGVRELLEELRRREIQVGIVTRNGRSFARETLQRLQLPIELVMTRDDAAPKPSPESLLKVLEGWQLPAARTAMVGDFRFDLEAGRAAGMRTVLYSADSTEEEIAAWRPLADFVVPSFVDRDPLLAWLERPFQTDDL